MPLVRGADDVWVYLTCIQALNSLDTTDAITLGLETIPAHMISVMRAELWKYAWEKVNVLWKWMQGLSTCGCVSCIQSVMSAV